MEFFFFTGYLKKCSEIFKDDIHYLELAIPNKEISYIYIRKIEEWMKETILAQKHIKLFESLLSGEAEIFQEELNVCLKRSISYMDTKELYYHGFLTGILDNMSGYQVRSNRESGNGRGDIFVMSYYDKKVAVIIEFKIAPSYVALDKYSQTALDQIENMKYPEELNHMGYYNIIKYGISFYKKDCKVKC